MLRLLPAVTLLIAALLAVLPFGVDEVVQYAIRFAPLMVAHYWSARRPALLPVPLIFGVGLTVDILTHLPLGYTALLALVVSGIAPLEAWASGRSTAIGRAAVFAVAMCVAAMLAWTIAAVYNGVRPDSWPFMVAALTSICLYPIMTLALMSIDRLWETPRAQIFVRGG